LVMFNSLSKEDRIYALGLDADDETDQEEDA